MIKKWLTWVNLFVSALALLFVLLGIGFYWMRPAEILVSDRPPPKTALPKRAFAMAKDAYDAIGEPLLSLQFAPMSQQLPDLKKYLLYFGKNGRPDAQADRPLMHFAFAGNKSISSVMPGQRLYLLYDRRQNPPQYIFSPGNAETSLWFEAASYGNEALVNVYMRGENGAIITEPEANARFVLQEKEFARFGGAPQWEIGKNRVDATLLARQKARWYGPDLFLLKHGGPEYANEIGKQRIDFGEGDEAYSVFVGVNDCLVWDTDHWKEVNPGPQSLGKPLLVVKKVDERLMNLELWDPEGKGKVYLNLLKSTDIAQQPNTILQQFKFVGARTRSQFVFEINKGRMLLSPHDWLLLTKEGWVKLVSPQEIDDYVERRITGPLFVFDEVERREDKQFLKGTLFNSARTDMQIVEIPLQQNTPAAPGNQKADEKSAANSRQAPQRASSGAAPRPRDEEEDDLDDDDDDEY